MSEETFDLRKYVESVRELYDWDNEIPNSIVHCGECKVRNSWFSAVSARASSGIRRGIVGDDVIVLREKFNRLIGARGFHERRKNEKDLCAGNRLLEAILAQLEPWVYGTGQNIELDVECATETLARI